MSTDFGMICGGGTAWDRETKGGFVNAFLETFKTSLVKPVPFFEEAAKSSNVLRPWLYAVIIYEIVFIAVAAYQLGFFAVGMNFGSRPSGFSSIPGISLGLFSLVVMAPVIATVGLFIGAALSHLCMMIVGAAKKDFTATFRVLCYSSAPNILHVVPFVGAFVGAVWSLVLTIIGLKVVHETTYGKSALAVFLPTIVCCGGMILLFAALAGGVTAGFMQALRH